MIKRFVESAQNGGPAGLDLARVMILLGNGDPDAFRIMQADLDLEDTPNERFAFDDEDIPF
ncbi:hypothetical protein [Asticcacaulis endophyticus]|nr:hypothetical protein [Asticcacaulis endophyticus]